jgi:hypothetical protein
MSSPAKSRIASLVTLAVVAHLVVTLIHGQAHTRLGVALANWQQIYVMVVILLAPLVAPVLSWTRFAKLGAWLLLVSMLGSLIFGAVYHYLIISSDHVAHLPPGEARGLFRTTALLLVITETFGVIVGAIGVRRFINDLIH